jgi:hypothetical protein
MNEKQEFMWIGSVAVACILAMVLPLGYFICKAEAINAEAKVKVAQEISRAVVDGIDGIGEWWKD